MESFCSTQLDGWRSRYTPWPVMSKLILHISWQMLHCGVPDTCHYDDSTGYELVLLQIVTSSRKGKFNRICKMPWDDAARRRSKFWFHAPKSIVFHFSKTTSYFLARFWKCSTITSSPNAYISNQNIWEMALLFAGLVKDCFMGWKEGGQE